MADSADITQWLDAARDGDRAALDQVLATLYQELHSMARRQLSGQYGQTLDATALVHEAYLKLVGGRGARFEDRTHFFAYAASAMRSPVDRVLIAGLAFSSAGSTPWTYTSSMSRGAPMQWTSTSAISRMNRVSSVTWTPAPP